MHGDAKTTTITSLLSEHLVVISCVRKYVGDVNNGPRVDGTRGHGLAIKWHWEVRAEELDLVPSDSADAGDLDEIAIEDRHDADLCITQVLCTLSDNLKNGCRVGWRPANDIQDVGGRVWRSSASLVSLNSLEFSIAITAWSAKVSKSAI